MNVEQAVLKVLIDNYPRVRNHDIMTAHPKHTMSGLARLRGLRLKGIVHYSFNLSDNTYSISTPIEDLQTALSLMCQGKKPGRSRGGHAGIQGTAGSHQPACAGTIPAPATKQEKVDLEEIRKFNKALEGL